MLDYNYFQGAENLSVEEGDSDIENTPETQLSLLHGSKLNSHETLTSPMQGHLKNQQKSFIS